ncbi:unnamed protein product [Rotaria socialis]|uniref:Uncharacterized protein n=1 Tax=Rotaria socialis TaxID=392032 RepID=A0A817UEI0_9BILA|nr:unnamed protein product [Rotaria socialis]
MSISPIATIPPIGPIAATPSVALIVTDPPIATRGDVYVAYLDHQTRYEALINGTKYASTYFLLCSTTCQ